MSIDNTPRLSPEDEEKIKRAIINEIVNRPPTIGLVGVSGTGKSSTLNSMFRTNLEISHVAACTKEFRYTDLRVAIREGQAAGRDAVLRVVDAPGLGEDLARDPDYLEMYRQNLEKCDVILWVLAARNRAIALDQMYLRQLSQFSGRMVFGINQVDLVDPLDWSIRTKLPSREQEANIALIVKDRKKRLEDALGRQIKIVPYSASYKYQLQELFTTLIESCPPNRGWIFSAIKGFRPEDFLPEGAREEILRTLRGKSEPKKRSARNFWRS